MQAKLNAAQTALRGGVARVLIAPGAGPRVIERILSGESVGTQVVSSEVFAQ
jgi:glutamate 5-kinase